MATVFHLLNAARILVVADALFSWVMDDATFPRSLTKAVLDPVYGPIRSLLGARIASIDLTPLLALGVLYLVEVVLKRSGNRAPR